MDELNEDLIIKSVETTSKSKESTKVLSETKNTIWDMKIRSMKMRYYYIVMIWNIGKMQFITTKRIISN